MLAWALLTEPLACIPSLHICTGSRSCLLPDAQQARLAFGPALTGSCGNMLAVMRGIHLQHAAIPAAQQDRPCLQPGLLTSSTLALLAFLACQACSSGCALATTQPRTSSTSNSATSLPESPLT
jgi:hypothetical protein